jgi:hypothetical protein
MGSDQRPREDFETELRVGIRVMNLYASCPQSKLQSKKSKRSTLYVIFVIKTLYWAGDL